MRKYFTIQIFSSDGKTAITRRFSKSLLTFIITISTLLLFGILALALFYGKAYVKALKVRNLIERNDYLEKEFKKVKKLERDIDKITKQRKKLEVVLGVTNKAKKSTIGNNVKPQKVQIEEDKKRKITLDNPEIKKYLEESKKISRSIPNLSPVNGWVTKGFDMIHRGVDIAAPAGTPIFSSMDGEVSSTGWDSILGNVVKIEGISGYTTIYGHCSNIFVKKGTLVRKGEIIASVGKTGRSDAPHLHYEIIMNGLNVNPELFFIKGTKK